MKSAFICLIPLATLFTTTSCAAPQVSQAEPEPVPTPQPVIREYYIEPFSFGVGAMTVSGGSITDDTADITAKGRGFVDTARGILDGAGLTEVGVEAADLVVEIKNNGRVLVGGSRNVVEEGQWRVAVIKPDGLGDFPFHDDADLDGAIQDLLKKNAG